MREVHQSTGLILFKVMHTKKKDGHMSKQTHITELEFVHHSKHIWTLLATVRLLPASVVPGRGMATNESVRDVDRISKKKHSASIQFFVPSPFNGVFLHRKDSTGWIFKVEAVNLRELLGNENDMKLQKTAHSFEVRKIRRHAVKGRNSAEARYALRIKRRSPEKMREKCETIII